ncbi:MAG TPA: VWA domain-containing protein [Polyangiaceae bacterium]|nr:VWA domain-containing protein [Polyangiaceae bacterium]
MIRLFDELLWRFRREGLALPTSTAVEAMRAVALVGLEDRETLRSALACAIVKRREDAAAFARAFDAFFEGRGRERAALFDRLAARGFVPDEIDALARLLAELAAAGAEAGNLHALLEGGGELARLLASAGMARALEGLASPLQRGFFVHRALAAAGAPDARKRLALLRSALHDALGARGDALADALADELTGSEDEVREWVDRRVQPPEPARHASLETKALASLDRTEVEEVRRAVRSFAARLRGKERVRRRRARRGAIDPHRTLRRTLRTFGVPMNPAHVRRRRDKPRLVLLCDVSDSVRAVAAFLLEFVSAAHDLFGATRSFVFVSEVGETTALFRREPVAAAIGAAYGGGVVPVTGNSNYGRALTSFVDRFGDAVDRRTTVVILGDGRTNYHDAGEAVLDRLRARARAVVWICPEPRARWAEGDSAMGRYAPRCTEVLEVSCARDLEHAARRIAARR